MQGIHPSVALRGTRCGGDPQNDSRLIAAPENSSQQDYRPCLLASLCGKPQLGSKDLFRKKGRIAVILTANVNELVRFSCTILFKVLQLNRVPKINYLFKS